MCACARSDDKITTLPAVLSRIPPPLRRADSLRAWLGAGSGRAHATAHGQGRRPGGRYSLRSGKMHFMWAMHGGLPTPGRLLLCVPWSIDAPAMCMNAFANRPPDAASARLFLAQVFQRDPVTKRIVLAQPDECMECGACTVNCPQNALKVEPRLPNNASPTYMPPCATGSTYSESLSLCAFLRRSRRASDARLP